jgi:predicted dehydrogenase
MNRRHFLAGSVAGLAFAQTTPSVNTAVIGTGGRGTYLLRGVIEQPGARVAALCDIKPDRLDAAATIAARDNPATYTDWPRIIERKDIDAVFIGTPPYLHSEMAIAALQAGKHVYCEKPIGITAAQVRALVAAAKASKSVFVAGQQLRSLRQIGEAVRRIHEGAIGEVIMVKAQREASADLPHDGSSGDWYFDVSKSGGYLIEQSVHNLDLCNWVIGAHPVRACGFGGILMYKNDPPGRTIFDCGSLTYDYPKGVKMSFTQSVFHPSSMPNGNQSVHVFGTKGGVDLMANTMLYPSEAGTKPYPLAAKQEEPPHAHLTAFYAAIVNRGSLPADITIGATAALTAILGHEAMTKERVMTWSELGVNL